MKRSIVLLLCAAMLFGLAACTRTDGGAAPAADAAAEKPVVKISIQNAGDVYVELDPSAAPITVENFLSLADRGFYNGLTFHRVISGFMIQGGDPAGNGTGGSGKNIKGEFSANGVANPINHVRGVISMARSSAMDSASSQFFIMHADKPHLDGQYAAFGHVIAGMGAVDRVAATTYVTDSNGTVAPGHAPVITSVARCTRQEAEAAAAREAENGRGGTRFTEPASFLSFDVPAGWHLTACRSGTCEFASDAGGASVTVSCMDYFAYAAGINAGETTETGVSRGDLTTESFSKGSLLRTIGVSDESAAAEEVHSGVTFYRADAADTGTVRLVGVHRGVVMSFSADPGAADALAFMLDSIGVP